MIIPMRQEQLIAANRGTAEFNLAILRTEAAHEGQPLTASDSSAAIRIALKLSLLVRHHPAVE
jgi:hypothetical protein